MNWAIWRLLTYTLFYIRFYPEVEASTLTIQDSCLRKVTFTLPSKVNLLKRLCKAKLTEHGDVENHLAEMQNLINELASLGEPLAEHLSVVLFLSSLPDSYGTLITALETGPEEDLTTELVKGKLLEEFKRKSKVFLMLNEQVSLRCYTNDSTFPNWYILT